MAIMTPLKSQGPEGRTAVYTIRVVRDIPFYVGLTAYPETRIRVNHTYDWWKFVTKVDIQWYATRREAEAAEVATIQMYEGLDNRRHTLPWKPSGVVRYPVERVAVGEGKYRFTLPLIAKDSSFPDGACCPGFYDLSTVQAFAWRAGILMRHHDAIWAARRGEFGPEGEGWISFYDTPTHISARSLRQYIARNRTKK